MSEKVTVAVEIDIQRLETYTDEYLAAFWHVAQANPAPIEDKAAGELAERIGREIIRRWLKNTAPPLFNHQGEHHYWKTLCDHGNWDAAGNWQPNPTA